MKQFRGLLVLFGISALLVTQSSYSLSVLISASDVRWNRQDVPAGVTYKRASQAVNEQVQSWLMQMLQDSKKVPPWFSGNLITVGPMLWKEIDTAADKRFGDTGRFMMMVQTSKPFVVPGGVLRTEPAREAFWEVLWKSHPELKSAIIRKAKARELSYYWAMIPFDIEEPFFTLDTGEKQFIMNVIYETKGISMIWIDLVGNLDDLGNQ